MAGTSAGAKKGALTKLKDNPHYFEEIGKLSKGTPKSRNWLKDNSDNARKIAKQRRKKS